VKKGTRWGHLLFLVTKPSLMLVLRLSQPEVRDKDDYFLLGFITRVIYEFLYRMFAKYLHNLLFGECLTLTNTVHIS
jgi:hypothetical protein